MRAVLDTNVLTSAFRSNQGASFELFRRLRDSEWTAVLSNHLLFEYEEILKRQAHDLQLTASDIDQILNAICARGEEWTLSREWKPILADPDDEPLVQLALESNAMRITTHNVRHLQPAASLGIEILKPKDFLTMLKSKQ